MGLLSRIKRGWNAFRNNRDPTAYEYRDLGQSYYRRPDRVRFSGGNERTITTSIYNRIAMDAADIDIRHVRLDKEDRFSDYVKSGLDKCLTVEANIDQTGRAFRHDMVASMLDEGVIAIVPVDTDDDPTESGSYTIETMRVGKIVEWYPAHVRIQLYNDQIGRKEYVTLPKDSVGIVENPLYAVINEHNSTMQRLVRKLSLLDGIDEKNCSGKLDLIIQLPYIIKTDARRQQAETRLNDIEDQLANSRHGIAYTDGTEKITQLNRPVENNLLKEIEYLTNMLFSQLGLSQSILDGTADEKTMLNYHNRTIKPIVSAIVDELKRKFLTKTARAQGQSIMFFRDHFELASVDSMAESADKLTRNEILSKNEIRQAMGYKPSSDPKADQLINSNISHPAEGPNKAAAKVPIKQPDGSGEGAKENLKEEVQNGEV